MPAYSTDGIRNVALLGHGGAGKTMLAEAMLAKSGAIATLGEITRGTTASDYDDQERDHQHSLQSSVLCLSHDNAVIHLIDTPGYPDFFGRTLSVLDAVETAAVVIDARSGIQLATRTVMETAGKAGLGRMLIVNKIDSDDVDFEALMASIVEAFGSECLPINLPAPGGTAVVDCFFRPTEAQNTAFSSADEAHTRIVDQVVEVDDQLMEQYLEQGEDISTDQLHDAFAKAMREGHLIPVCFTSVNNDVGVAKLLELIARMMPSPAEGNRPAFFEKRGGEEIAVDVAADSNAPVIAHAFKVMVDPFVGKLSVLRIHQGTISKDSQLLIDDARKPFKVGHLFKMHGKEHVEVDDCVAGDICAVAKIDDIHYGSVLHTSHDQESLRLESISLPEPMYGLAISSSSRGDEQKLSDSLSKLCAEDPCLRVEHNTALNETVLKGLGELHLRIVLERMQQRFNVGVETRPPRIAYRETVKKSAEGHHRHKKQTGGAGQFGEVYLRLEPLGRGAGFEFVDKVVGGAIPHQFIPAVEKGIRQVMESGAVAGYPMEDLRVTVYDGKHHPVDSKEVAFVAAGRKAFLDAVSKAGPQILEPMVDVHITVPQEAIGDITGDLSSRRGRINGTTAASAGQVSVDGQAPLAELVDYPSHLKSVTGGAGTFSMAFSHYDPVPNQVQSELVSAFSPQHDED